MNKIISDERVKVVPHTTFIAEPSKVTPEDGFAFNLVARIVHQTRPNTVVTPFLMIGGTDSWHMEAISDQIIKFSPMIDPLHFHGIDERVSIESYGEAMWFFENLIRSANTN